MIAIILFTTKYINIEDINKSKPKLDILRLN